MAPSPVQPPPIVEAPAQSRLRIRRLVALVLLAAVHAGGLGMLYATEYGWFGLSLAFLTWISLNAAFLALLRRPLASAALSLVVIGILIVLSDFKFSISQLTLTFLDFLIIDRDTVAFLMALFPQLRDSLLVALLAAVPAAFIVWRCDIFRVGRVAASCVAMLALAAITGASWLKPEQPWEPFSGVNHVSNFARSGVSQVSYLLANSWIETDRDGGMFARAHASIGDSAGEACTPSRKPPHIIMVLDESSFDVTAAPGIKVPEGYGDFFRSADGMQRAFVAESTGGPTWYTEFNVLTGLSSRSFGDLRYYVTRIAAGRIQRGLPQALTRCGYRTFSLYPSTGNFLSARSFQQTAGIDHFLDKTDMGAPDEAQPDKFYFDRARDLFAREQGRGDPLFIFVYTALNHFPWTRAVRPDRTPDWTPPGNGAEADEYIRRQQMTQADYAEFVARLAAEHPGEEFLIVRFGDHQPAISHKLLEPDLDPARVATKVRRGDLRYYTTYYAIDTINYGGVDWRAVPARIDAAYLPVIVQEAAGLPLDSTFAEQKRIMQRCGGVFHACNGGHEARRFNRLLIEAGLIKGL